MGNDQNQKKMGRPPKPKGTARNRVVAARFTEAEHRAIKRKAGALGPSEWARQALLRASSKH